MDARRSVIETMPNTGNTEYASPNAASAGAPLRTAARGIAASNPGDAISRGFQRASDQISNVTKTWVASEKERETAQDMAIERAVKTKASQFFSGETISLVESPDEEKINFASGFSKRYKEFYAKEIAPHVEGLSPRAKEQVGLWLDMTSNRHGEHFVKTGIETSRKVIEDNYYSGMKESLILISNEPGAAAAEIISAEVGMETLVEKGIITEDKASKDLLEFKTRAYETAFASEVDSRLLELEEDFSMMSDEELAQVVIDKDGFDDIFERYNGLVGADKIKQKMSAINRFQAKITQAKEYAVKDSRNREVRRFESQKSLASAVVDSEFDLVQSNYSALNSGFISRDEFLSDLAESAVMMREKHEEAREAYRNQLSLTEDIDAETVKNKLKQFDKVFERKVGRVEMYRAEAKTIQEEMGLE